jgi:hypothetical protein
MPARIVKSRSKVGPLDHGSVAACGEQPDFDLEQMHDRIQELEALIRLLLEERVAQGRG